MGRELKRTQDFSDTAALGLITTALQRGKPASLDLKP